MAATHPAVPQTQPSTATPPARSPIYQPPTTPQDVARERERVALLLTVNQELLQHLVKLQTEGKGALIASQTEGAVEGIVASHEYTQCLRCIQANITFIASTNNEGGVRRRQGTLAGPAIMDSPNDLPVFVQHYENMEQLFPGWKSMVQTVQNQARAVSSGLAALPPAQPNFSTTLTRP